MMKQLALSLGLVLLLVGAWGCGGGSGGGVEDVVAPGDTFDLSGSDTLDAGDTAGPDDGLALVPFHLGEGQVTEACQAALDKAEAALVGIAALTPEERSFENTVLALEDATATLWEELGPLTFLAYVSTDADQRDEAYDCETQLYQYAFEVFTRAELYEAIKDQSSQDAEEAELLETFLDWFEGSGLGLPSDQQELLATYMNQISEAEATFGQNLAEDGSTVAFTKEELAGVDEAFLEGLPTDDEGRYLVGADYSEYLEVIQNASNAETRRLIMLNELNRAGEANTALLEEALVAREAAAQLLGYDNWADYKIDGRMAGDAATALQFQEDLLTALKPRLQDDLARLLAYKQELDSEATALEPWDIPFLAWNLSQRDYAYDPDELRDYFPVELVQEGLFQVFGELFDLDFEPVEDAKVWAPEVKVYRVLDGSSGELLAEIFTDLWPRDGKYGWFAMFELRTGRLVDGEYQTPVAGIVGNFTPAEGDKPALLYLDEVETLFHEFGHVMHSILYKGRFASFGLNGVAWDFVEMPSQLMQCFPSKKEVLQKLSGHYGDHAQKLPEELLDKALAASGFNLGWSYSRQLQLGLFDLEIHTRPTPVDVTAVYDEMYGEMMGIQPLAGAHFPASFDHLMGGYDAGYYGYIWSEVQSLDAFSEFEKAGILDASTGARLRSAILERGALEDPNALMETFLQRAQSNQRFLEKLGLTEE